MSPTIEKSSHVVIGQINGLYGVHGGLKVFSYTSPRERIFSYRPWLLNKNAGWTAADIVSHREQGKGLVVFLRGVTDREQAGRLVGAEIAVTREQLPPLPAGEYYWSDLLDMEVIDMQDRILGKVMDIQETGANDVIVVRGDRQHMIPWVTDEIIKRVDIASGRIYVDWDTGYQ